MRRRYTRTELIESKRLLHRAHSKRLIGEVHDEILVAVGLSATLTFGKSRWTRALQPPYCPRVCVICFLPSVTDGKYPGRVRTVSLPMPLASAVTSTRRKPPSDIGLLDR